MSDHGWCERCADSDRSTYGAYRIRFHQLLCEWCERDMRHEAEILTPVMRPPEDLSLPSHLSDSGYRQFGRRRSR
jgi:hypothetical protein